MRSCVFARRPNGPKKALLALSWGAYGTIADYILLPNLQVAAPKYYGPNAGP